MNIAYIRVSTVEQNEQRQIEAMKPFNIEKWFMFMIFQDWHALLKTFWILLNSFHKKTFIW